MPSPCQMIGAVLALDLKRFHGMNVSSIQELELYIYPIRFVLPR